jgi:hypothetical protein
MGDMIPVSYFSTMGDMIPVSYFFGLVPGIHRSRKIGNGYHVPLF